MYFIITHLDPKLWVEGKRLTCFFYRKTPIFFTCYLDRLTIFEIIQILLLTDVKKIDRNSTLMTTDNSQQETRIFLHFF